MAFTLIFKGSIRDFKENPFTTETPYGTAYAAGVGDSFKRCDALEEALEKIAGGGVRDVEDFAQDVLDRAARLPEDAT